MPNLVASDLKQLMVDSLHELALLVVDTEGKLLSWNAGAKDLLGYDEAEAVGKPFSWTMPPDDSLDPAEALTSLAIARKDGRHEWICHRAHRSGAIIAVREVVTPLRDAQHNLLAFGLMIQSLGSPIGEGTNQDIGAASDGIGQQLSLMSARKATRVLAVDDDDNVRAIAMHLLEELGYEVLTAASGEDALDILTREEGIDVLFTDVVMPAMTGSELAQRARLLRPGLKILFTSGYFEHALVKNGRIARDANLLVKPYHGVTLAKKMQMTLANDGPDL